MTAAYRLALATLIAGQLGLAPLAAAAADAKDDPNSKTTILKLDPADTSLFAFNYGPTQSPALGLLNVSPSKATLYTSNQPFILSIPSLFDSSGQTALGLDVSPAWATQGSNPITKQRYLQADDLEKFWYRLRVELAGSNGAASATNPAKLQPSGIAIGFSSAFLHQSDPITANIGHRKGSYFDDCLAATGKTGQSLNARIDTANGKLVELYKPMTKAVDDMVRDVLIVHDEPSGKNRADALSRAAVDIATYRSMKSPPPNGPTLLSKPRVAPTPVGEAIALAEFSDLFRKDAADTAHSDPGRSAADIVMAEDIDTLAADRGPAVAAPASSVDQERIDVAVYLDGLPPTDPWYRQLRRLSHAAAFPGGLPAVAAPGGPALPEEQADLIRLATFKNNDGEYAGALESAREALNKTFDSNVATRLYTDADITKDLTTCVQAATLVASAGRDITAGIGLVEAGKPGSLQNLYPGGQTLWVAVREPIWTNFKGLDASDLVGDKSKAMYVLAGGSLIYQHEAIQVTGNATTPLIKADVSGVWLGVEGFGPKYRGGLQVGYTDTHATRGSQSQFSTSGFRWETSAAYQIFSGTWLGVAYGTARGSTTKLDDRTALVTLQFSTPPAANLFGKPNGGSK